MVANRKSSHFMKALPSHVEKYKQTKVFTQETVPAGLLKNHQTMQNVWGKIVVVKGKLNYIIEENNELNLVDEKTAGIIEPEALHRVEMIGEVEFYVEFYK